MDAVMMSIDDDTFFLLLIRPLGETGYSRVLMSAESLDFDENYQLLFLIR